MFCISNVSFLLADGRQWYIHRECSVVFSEKIIQFQKKFSLRCAFFCSFPMKYQALIILILSIFSQTVNGIF